MNNSIKKPIPLEIERDGKDVYVKMTTQITDIEIEPGLTYKAWTFNGEAPVPLIVVEEGDVLHFEVENINPAIPHSIDLHAVHTNPEVVFSSKALHEGQPNTNGTTTALKDEPLKAKVGEKVRLYVNNVGPNEVSSFHVIGTIMEDVYLDGNPYNHYEGSKPSCCQRVAVPLLNSHLKSHALTHSSHTNLTMQQKEPSVFLK